MQYLWIGCLESEEEFKQKAEKGYNLASAQVSQLNIVNGLEKQIGQNLDSINGSVLPPYPMYEDKFIKETIWQHKPECFDISVGYKNLKYVNRIACKKAMIEAADKWIAERYQGDGVVLFVYSMRSAPMATACHIKKIIKGCNAYLIVTDLPQFMDLGQSKIKAALKQIDWISIKRMQGQFDGFILYASKMADYLNIPKGKWILMEGSYDVQENENYHLVLKKRKAIMYSGKMDVQYGINLLLEAFMQIEDAEAELWLTGGGNAEEYVKKCAEKDSRIKYFGFLASRGDVLRKQQSAGVLVNMRLPSEKASDYCFPSKLFEYMATGNFVISFKLGGIPKEYYPYLYLIENESITSLKETMEVCLKENEKNRGKQARSFIVENKNSTYQCKKIVDFIIQMQEIH